MAVAAKDKLIILKKVQPEGKKVMSGKDFLNGYLNLLSGRD
ncbi:MAG: hypothetical protein HYT34_02470 [Candidatus Ryanbacteria bacterium]|nr:hypothetical protein [Candidatus Ryanbacteria bacterium]